MESDLPHVAVYLTAAFGTAAVLLSYSAFRSGSPITAIFSRWCRWIFLANIFGMVAVSLGADRPFWVMGLCGFLFWMLLETTYNWMAIAAISRSELPLFPRFRENTSGDEWPADPKFIDLRDYLRKQGYEKQIALKAQIEGTTIMRNTVYDSADGWIRLQVLFIPNPSGSQSVCFIASSATEDGVRIITDNIFTPYGGFYPETWQLERKPWVRGLPKVLERHKRRIEPVKDTLKVGGKNPLSDINEQQIVLEQVNTENGFLVPYPRQEEEGKITNEGRYRVWKELWLLNYFGRPSSG